ELSKEEEPIDMFVTNYIYDKLGAIHKKSMRYTRMLPQNTVFGWDDLKEIHRGHYILMHSVIYKTAMLRECGIKLPEHTFYVDNIYVYYPMPYVKKMYYMNVDLYHYFIGREDQSVHESIMIRRIDQQILVNKIMADDYDLRKIKSKNCRRYMFKYLEIICAISTVLLIKSGTEENNRKKEELWKYIKDNHEWLHRQLKGSIMGKILYSDKKAADKATVWMYGIIQKVFGFN
ncbi:MAG: glycosyl transferase, partial [Lachnospiraceae bacterium]|nr:glycosyl transferase [Lachnospiraceae bacterium]